MEETAELERIILQSVDEAVIATDLVGNIIYWNEGATKLYGWQKSEVLGRLITTVTPSQMSQEQAVMIMKQLGQGDTWTGEFGVRKRDGTEFVALVNDRPIYKDGQLYGVVGVSVDVNDVSRLSPTSELRAVVENLSSRASAVVKSQDSSTKTAPAATTFIRTRRKYASSRIIFNEARAISLFESLGMLRPMTTHSDGIDKSSSSACSQEGEVIEEPLSDSAEAHAADAVSALAVDDHVAPFRDCRTSEMMSHILDCVCALKAAQDTQDRVAAEENQHLRAAETSVLLSAISAVLHSDDHVGSGLSECEAFCTLVKAFPQSVAPPSLTGTEDSCSLKSSIEEILGTDAHKGASADARTQHEHKQVVATEDANTETDTDTDTERSFLPLHWGTVLSTVPGGADINAVKTIFASDPGMLHWSHSYNQVPGVAHVAPAARTDPLQQQQQQQQQQHQQSDTATVKGGDHDLNGLTRQQVYALHDVNGLTPAHLLASMREPNMELATLFSESDPEFAFRKSLLDGRASSSSSKVGADVSAAAAAAAVGGTVTEATATAAARLPKNDDNEPEIGEDDDDEDDDRNGHLDNEDQQAAGGGGASSLPQQGGGGGGCSGRSRANNKRRRRLEGHDNDVDDVDDDDGGYLPLHMAAMHSASVDMFRFLLKNNSGAVRRRAGPYRRSPLHFLVTRPANSIPPEVTVELVMMLLNVDPDIAMLGDVDGVTPFHLLFWRGTSTGTAAATSAEAVCAKSTELLIRLVLTLCPGAAQIVHPKYAMYPLHLAVTFLPAAIAEAVMPDLLTAYKDAAAMKDNRDNLPVFIAAETATSKTVQLLLEAFPDALQRRDAGDRNIFHRVASRGDGDSFLVRYLSTKHPEVVKVVDDKGLTPLHYAVYYGSSLAFLRVVYDADPSAIQAKTVKHDALPAHVALVLALESIRPPCPLTLSRRVDFFRFLINKYPAAATASFWDDRTAYSYCLHKNAPLFVLRILLRADRSIAPATLHSLNYRERRDALFLAFLAKSSDGSSNIFSRLRDCDAGELSLLKEVVAFL